ncbi:hypothetical protein BDY19DRAFT_517817 [Irpex rosettiformis]|uniref:Uncharacterized protein n=1 Tax=Irpex rosettiformis TaxID=378272 RepID=A0ACB8TRY0_9APHY|nr:hypothetical protein BDY19DRAFT_517817 [Irpex rosettiformis]
MLSPSHPLHYGPKPFVKSISGIPGWRSHVIYIDRGMLVINKPAGLVSQPGPLIVSCHLPLEGPNTFSIRKF